MTTYGTNVRIGNSNTATLPSTSGRTQGSLNRTPRTYPGGKSEIKPFGQGLNPSNKNPSATSPGDNNSTAKGVGKLPSAAKGVGKIAGRATPGVGINAKGDVEVGLRVGGAGIAISVKGDVSLGVPGLSVVINPKNLSNTTVDLGYGTATVEQIREGCTITVNVSMFGKIVNSDTRQADNCVEPEPTPSPSPQPIVQPTPAPTPAPPSGYPSSDDFQPSTSESTVTRVRLSWLTPGKRYSIKWNSQYKLNFTTNAYLTAENYFKGEYQDDLTINLPATTYDPFWGSSTYGFYVASDTILEIKETKRTYSYWGQTSIWVDGKWVYYLIFGVVRNTTKSLWWYDGSNLYNSFGWSGRLYEGTGSHSQSITEITREQAEDSDFINNYRLVWGEPGLDFTAPRGWAVTPWLPGKGSAKSTLEYIEAGLSPQRKGPYGTPSRIVPKVKEECDCELLEDIYEMLGGDAFLNNGLTIPTQVFTPDGQGQFKMKTYNEIMNIIFRTFSHRTPGEIEFTIEDTNKGKEGNQKVEIRTINAQGYYTMLMKSVANLGYENTDQMNLLVRLGVITSQLMKIVVIINQSLKNVVSFFDIPVKDNLEKVDIPFDLSLKSTLNKGFASREDLQKELLKIVDKDTEEAIEGMLDKFLNEWQMPVKTEKLRSTKEGGNFWYFLKQLR